MSILLTRPRYDRATHYLYHWSEGLASLATYDLRGARVNKKTVESFLKKKSPNVVIFNGHGDDFSIRGHNGEELISSKINPGILAGKIAYFRACNAGNILGPSIVRSGANGFVGYREPFMFPYDEYSVAKPLQDEKAKACLESSNSIAFTLIRRRSAREAHLEGLRVSKMKISEMLNSGAPNSYIIWFLNWNMLNQVWG